MVGTDLGGLMFAALAARHGYRVAVLGQRATTNTYRHEGALFFRRPERFYGFSTSPAIARVFGELSLTMEMRTLPRPINPTLQVAMPGTRLDILRDGDRWRRELEREFPGTGRILETFDVWADDRRKATDPLLASNHLLPPNGFRANAKYRKLLESVPTLRELLDKTATPGIGPLEASPRGAPTRAMVEGIIGHLATLGSGVKNPLTAARLWSHLRAGLYRFPEGLDGLKRLFLSKIKEQCGDYRPEAGVDEIVIKRGKVQGVILSDRSEMLGCDLLVSNMDPRRFAHIISPDSRIDAFHNKLSAAEPSGWQFCMNLSVNPEVIPTGMGPEVVLIGDPEAPLVGDNCLWISMPGRGAGSPDTPKEEETLVLTSRLLARGVAPTAQMAEDLAYGMLARLRTLIPWIDDHIRAMDTACLTRDPQTGRLDFNLSELVPIVNEPLPMTLNASSLGPKTAYKNILMGGDALFGGLGFEGLCLGALQTLEHAQQIVKLKTSLKGDTL